MSKIKLITIVFVTVFVLTGCGDKKQQKKNISEIESFIYSGDYVAASVAYKVYDFVFMYYYNQYKDIDISLQKANLFSLSYYIASKETKISDEEKQEIIKMCDQIADLKNQLYSAKGFDKNGVIKYLYGISLDQFTVYSIMESVINKYKSSVEQSFEFNEQELTSYYKQNENKYKGVLIQILFYSVKDENGIPYTEDKKQQKVQYALDHIKNIKNGTDMDDLIRNESEDPAVSETGGKMQFIISEYQKEDKIYEFITNPNTKIGDMTVITDEFGIYLLRLEEYEDYDNNTEIREKIKKDYFNIAFENEMQTKSAEYELTETKTDLMETIAQGFISEEE